MYKVEPDDENIYYVGRWDKRQPGAYSTSWGGTYFKVNFSNTTIIRLHIGASVNVYVSIDGVTRYYPSLQGVVDITPVLLHKGTHTLMVATPYTDQCLVFQGMSLDDQARISLPSTGKRMIEYIGASIIAGHLLPRYALSDYAWLAAERLGYEHIQIAQSGMGLVDHWPGGSYIANGAGMSQQYFKLKHADHDDDTLYDFFDQSPDIVIIHIGTNDAVFGVPADRFQYEYTRFLGLIRQQYPVARLYAQRLFDGTYAQEIQQSVRSLQAAGDQKVHYIDTSGWLQELDYIDGVHPNESAHIKLSKRLVAVLEAKNR
ncbi:GDSL-type esterase/lipase family protein [Paenibacillus hunanensis]|uniref:GDSL-type esterase/lipase family protein n=1 Tax=Paenibacillus hunanensis TaxID=539262 RepID=UPI0020263EB2|nr:GDSL-type esterase/lipase family protein [Paenibacillus hunanensis]MCL9662655.1 GDSL-type esterase/lipase family protein [Paenibacillus hunanensis]